MSIKLDLSKFKHVKSDDKTTTLRHDKDGHEITLAHKALSKDNQAALAKLAEMANGDTIKTDSAAKGVKEASEKPSLHGRTIQVEKDEQKPKYGKVKGPDGEKAQVFQSGGKVEPSAWDKLVGYTPAQPKPDMNKEAVPQDKAKDMQKVFGDTTNKAEGGMVQHYNQGTPDVEQMTSFDPNQMPESSAPQDPNAKYQDLYSELKDLGTSSNLDHSAPAEIDQRALDAASTKKANDEDASNQSAAAQMRQAEAQNAKRAELGLPPVEVPGQMPSREPQGEMPQEQAAQMPQPQAQDPMADYSQLLKGGYEKQMAGIQGAANAQGALGQEQAKALDEGIKAKQEAASSYMQQYNALEQERQDHMNDIRNAQIDPNKYWDNHSKVAAAIGMIIGGFSPATGSNGAIDMLKYQMDQNVNAQAKNLDTQNNLLAANLKQFGNLKDAMDMTRLMQADVVQNQLLSAAAKASNPQAQAAAQQAAGKLMMEYAPLQQNIAIRQSMMKFANNGTDGDPSNTAAAEHMIASMRMTNPEMAKEWESRLVPGVGMAKMPIPTEVRSEIIGKQNFDKMAQHYVDWVKHNSGSLNPAKIAEGATMAAELQGAYRNAVKGGVYKEGEQSFIEKLIPSDPAQFAASLRTLPKLNTLIQSNNAQLNSLKQGFGLPQAQTSQANSPVKGKDGRMYMRQGNFMVPVK